MSIFSRLETFAYKHVFVPRQGKHTFDFIGDLYSKGEKVIDFGSGIGTNSRLKIHHTYFVPVKIADAPYVRH